MSYYSDWEPYVSVTERRTKASRKLASLEKSGKICQPVIIGGRRTIASTFWGKKWCANLEAYNDYSNRLPRGRSYVRNGSVIDLQILKGEIKAQVFGSTLYKVHIMIRALDPQRWQAILDECAGKVASIVELLQGRLSSTVMEIVTRQSTGLFPAPGQINFYCSCPDSAFMCKHIAATLYGVGARLDDQPELLFQLCHVDPMELIKQAGNVAILDVQPDQHQKLDTSDLSALFGIELDEASVTSASPVSETEASSRTQSKAIKEKMAVLDQEPLSKFFTARALLARGIPRATQQAWLKSGVLQRTAKPGVYCTTSETEPRIEKYLSARGKARSK